MTKKNITENKRPIALIGFMGVGKTDIGRALSRKTGRSLIDLDRIIETMGGMDIPSIFREEGEEMFRSLETIALNDMLSEPSLNPAGMILSCGGGIVTNPANRDLLKKCAITVWIEADIAECLGRIKQGSRPLLMRTDAREFAEKLYNQRVPLYTQAADIIAHTSGMDVETAAGEIINKLIVNN